MENCRSVATPLLAHSIRLPLLALDATDPVDITASVANINRDGRGMISMNNWNIIVTISLNQILLLYGNINITTMQCNFEPFFLT